MKTFINDEANLINVLNAGGIIIYDLGNDIRIYNSETRSRPKAGVTAAASSTDN